MLLLDLYLVMDDDDRLYFTVDSECYYNFAECPEQYLNRQVKKIECLPDNQAIHVVLI